MTNQHLESLKKKQTQNLKESDKMSKISKEIEIKENLRKELKLLDNLPYLITDAIIHESSFYIPCQNIASYIFAVLKVMEIDFSIEAKIETDPEGYCSDDYRSNYFTILSKDKAKSNVKYYQRHLDKCTLDYKSLIDQINNCIKEADLAYNTENRNSWIKIEDFNQTPSLDDINMHIYKEVKNATFPENIKTNYTYQEKFNKKAKNKEINVPKLSIGNFIFVIIIIMIIIFAADTELLWALGANIIGLFN